MDYASLDNTRRAIGATETSDDPLLKRCITEASRIMDRKCARFANSDNYFELESIVNENHMAIVDAEGNLVLYPRKAIVKSVESVQYRYGRLANWLNVDASLIDIRGYVVKLYTGVQGQRGYMEVVISYTGGFSSNLTDLPADLVNLAELLAVRLYREFKSGLSDSIGIADLGTLQYTKAMPVRVEQLLAPYVRWVGTF